MGKLKHNYRQFYIGDFVVVDGYVERYINNDHKVVFVERKFEEKQKIGIICGPTLKQLGKVSSGPMYDDYSDGYTFSTQPVGTVKYLQCSGTILLWQIKFELIGKTYFCLPHQLHKMLNSWITSYGIKRQKEMPIKQTWDEESRKWQSNFMKDLAPSLKRDVKGRFIKS